MSENSRDFIISDELAGKITAFLDKELPKTGRRAIPMPDVFNAFKGDLGSLEQHRFTSALSKAGHAGKFGKYAPLLGKGGGLGIAKNKPVVVESKIVSTVSLVELTPQGSVELTPQGSIEQVGPKSSSLDANKEAQCARARRLQAQVDMQLEHNDESETSNFRILTDQAAKNKKKELLSTKEEVNEEQLCPSCDHAMEYRNGDEKLSYKDQTRTIQTLAWWCTNCNEAIFSDEAIVAHEKAFKEFKNEVDKANLALKPVSKALQEPLAPPLLKKEEKQTVLFIGEKEFNIPVSEQNIHTVLVNVFECTENVEGSISLGQKKFLCTERAQ